VGASVVSKMEALLRALVFLVAMSVTAMAADAPPAVVAACKSDALRFCLLDALSGSQARVSACMTRHTRVWSNACKSAVRDWKSGE